MSCCFGFLGGGAAATPQKQICMRGPEALKGQVALVTGAAGAMGRNIAESLLSAGAIVYLGDMNLERAEAVAKDLEGACAESARAVPGYVDVTSEESVAELFGRMATEHGPCDILVNSAGIMHPPTKTEDLPAEKFNRLMNVNVTGAFICAKEAFKTMKKRNGGRIINIGSIAAIAPRGDAVAYTVSKFAMEGLTKSLALDGRAHKIAVGIVHPGNVLSDLITPAEVKARKAKGEDFMDPKVVAECVLHICSMPAGTTCLELVVMPTVQPLIGRG